MTRGRIPIITNYKATDLVHIKSNPYGGNPWSVATPVSNFFGSIPGVTIRQNVVADRTIFLQVDYTAVDPDVRNWNWFIKSMPNTAGGALDNNICVWGYNPDPTAGCEDKTEPSLAIHLETNYDPLGGAHTPYMEYHLNLWTIDDAVHLRPFKYDVARDGSWGETWYTTDKINWRRRDTEAQIMTLENSDLYLFDITISKLTNGPSFLLQRNAALDAFVNIAYVNALDQVVIGGPNANYIRLASSVQHTGTELGFFSAVPVAQQTKAAHNNWANISDVVNVLLAYGLVDAA